MDMQTQSMYKIARSYLKTMRMPQMPYRIPSYPVMKSSESENNKYFQTWLTRILINKCKDILHKRN